MLEIPTELADEEGSQNGLFMAVLDVHIDHMHGPVGFLAALSEHQTLNPHLGRMFCVFMLCFRLLEYTTATRKDAEDMVGTTRPTVPTPGLLPRSRLLGKGPCS